VTTDKYAHDYVRHYRRMSPPAKVLELGVWHGGSLELWRELWPDAIVVGVDLAIGEQARYAAQRADAKVLVGDVTKKETWLELEAFGKFDLVVDDASHRVSSMTRALELGWGSVAPSGAWAIEDTCCAFWPEFADASLLEYVDARIRDLHWHGEREHGLERDVRLYRRPPRNVWEATLDGIEIMNGMVVFFKRGE